MEISAVNNLIQRNFISLIMRVMGALSLFLLFVLTARNLPPTEYGLFSYYFALSVLFGAFVQWGMPPYLLKIFASGGNNLQSFKILIKSFYFSIFLMAVLLLILFSINTLFEFKSLIVIAASIITAFFLAIVNMISGVLNGLKKRVSLIFLLYFLPYFLYNIGVTFIDKSIVNFILLFMFSSLLASFIAYSMLKLLIRKYRWPSFKISYLNEILGRGSSFVFLAVGILLLNWMDVVLANVIVGEVATAQYNSASRIIFIVAIVASVLNTYTTPLYAQYYIKNDIKSIEKLAHEISKLLFISSVIISILVILNGDFALGLFGSIYKESYLLLMILLAGQAFNLVTSQVGPILTMTNNEKLLTSIFMKAIFINLILNIVLGIYFGVIGIAIATAIAVVYWNISGIYAIKSILGISVVPFGYSRKPGSDVS